MLISGAPISGAPVGGVPNAGGSTPVFSLSPSSTSATGTLAVTATGSGTTWSGSNPFSISSGPASGLTNYVRISDTSATFDITVTALSGTIVIADSNSGTTANIAAVALVPNAPTDVVLTDNNDGTVTASYTQASSDGGAAITGNTLLTSEGQTASAGSPGADITFTPVNGVEITAQVRATNSVGDGPYSDASAAITPNNTDVVSVMIRAPYLSTDTLGTKTVQLFHIVGGALVAATLPITTGFTAIPSVSNGWWVLIDVTPNGGNGEFSGIAVFSNINGTGKAAVEAYSAPTVAPGTLVAHKIAPFLSTDTITTPGYQLYSRNGAAYGSHVTSGILAISGVTNGYVARVSVSANTPAGGAHYGMLWDGG